MYPAGGTGKSLEAKLLVLVEAAQLGVESHRIGIN